jgi:hypothetical protein
VTDEIVTYALNLIFDDRRIGQLLRCRNDSAVVDCKITNSGKRTPRVMNELIDALGGATRNRPA